jgi:hypothetical protein
MECRLSVRDIDPSDFEAVAKFLGEGIGFRPEYFLHLFQALEKHSTPAGYPKYGQILESDGTIVGAIILIYSTVHSEAGPRVRCQVTGWCVKPDFRPYAALFFARELKRKDVTYLNLSAQGTPAALRVIEAQGFTRYTSGQYVAVVAKLLGSGGARIVKVNECPNAPFEPFEQELLKIHASYGCICFWCETPERAYPFVFRRRLFKRVIPGVHLIYCHDMEDLRRFAGPIGRFLALRGRLLARFDSDGPIPGMIGRFREGTECRYYMGSRPRLGDLAYTQAAMSPYVRWKKQRARAAILSRTLGLLRTAAASGWLRAKSLPAMSFSTDNRQP